MAGVNTITTRTDTRQSPEQVLADAIITALPEASLVLGAGPRRVTLSRAQARIPVLSTFPEAYWVSGDTGLKQTTKETWSNKWINVEELAVIVPVPDNVVADTDYDILSSIRPKIVESIGIKIDEAVLFGVSKPTSWDLGDGPTANGIAQVANAKGRAVTAGATVPTPANAQVYADVIATTKKVATDGHPVTGYLADSLYEYELLGQTDTTGRPLFTPSAQAGGVSSLIGRPFRFLNNGAWDDAYKLIAGDLSTLIVGIRQDISWQVFTEGVISDSTGKVVLNLMQQDSRALRVTIRLGVTVGAPIRRRSADDPNAYSFAVLKAA